MFESCLEPAKQDAISRYPEESCGVIVNDTYISCKNISAKPLEGFEIDKETLKQYIIEGTLQAVIHSHPYDKLSTISAPSEADMRGQISTSVPWGIIDVTKGFAKDPYWFGDMVVLDTPLIGQTFQHGVQDCYTLIRKYYWQKRKILLKDYARDDQWWEKGGDFYKGCFEEVGFRKISIKELRDGDVVLGKINSKHNVINHGGIFLDNPIDGHGIILHHLPQRLSRREPAAAWLNRADMFLRYNDAT